MTGSESVAADGRDRSSAGETRARPSDRAAAFEIAVQPHYQPLVRRLVLVVGNEPDAQDLAQEACLRAYRSWDGFDGRDVRGWLYTIALRLAFDHLRRRRRWRAIVGRGQPPPWTDRSDPDLWAALRSLDAGPRAALLLNLVDGYTQREIAGMLDVPEGTISSWISRARASLRERLDPGR
jgi:RNA polymerase sigma-70 factor (ECF subfamily)